MAAKWWWYAGPILAGAGVFVLDRITKLWWHQQAGIQAVWPNHLWFQSQLNDAMALSLPLIPWLYYVVLGVVLIVVVYLLVQAVRQLRTLEYYLTTIILMAAIGNLYDRIVYGGVIDFIHVQLSSQLQSTIFNVADVAIVVSIGVWGLHIFRHEQVSAHN